METIGETRSERKGFNRRHNDLNVLRYYSKDISKLVNIINNEIDKLSLYNPSSDEYDYSGDLYVGNYFEYDEIKLLNKCLSKKKWNVIDKYYMLTSLRNEGDIEYKCNGPYCKTNKFISIMILSLLNFLHMLICKKRISDSDYTSLGNRNSIDLATKFIDSILIKYDNFSVEYVPYSSDHEILKEVLKDYIIIFNNAFYDYDPDYVYCDEFKDITNNFIDIYGGNIFSQSFIIDKYNYDVNQLGRSSINYSIGPHLFITKRHVIKCCNKDGELYKIAFSAYHDDQTVKNNIREYIISSDSDSYSDSDSSSEEIEVRYDFYEPFQFNN